MDIMEKLTGWKKSETGRYYADNADKTRRYVVQLVSGGKWQALQFKLTRVHFDSDNTDLYLAENTIDKLAWSDAKWEAIADANIMEATILGDRDAIQQINDESDERRFGKDFMDQLRAERATR